MKTRLPTSREIAALVAFHPELCAEGFTPIKGWRGGGQGLDGEIAMPQPQYDDLVEKFFRTASSDCWSDYVYQPDVAGRMLEDCEAVKNATLSEIQTMLTYCVRGERFCDGHWGAMIECGHIRRILKRLAEF